MGLDVAHAVAGVDLRVGGILARLDDDQPVPVVLEMALDQRQRAAPDGAEADHHDRAGDFAIYRIGAVCHLVLLRTAALR